ncbi:MAG: FecR family protein [Pedobacter sp.]|nr:MAG: FecR family protein [Pedobacter sp.]
MRGKDIENLLRDEGFLNYCFDRNEADVRYWNKWLDENPDLQRELEELKKIAILLAHETMQQEIDENYYLLQQRINTSAETENDPQQFSFKKLLTRLGIAASILIICSLGIYFSLLNNKKPDVTTQANNTENDVLPGDSKAILTLANGTKISLSDIADGNVAKQAGISITKIDGKLIYTIDDTNTASVVGYNTISTPSGGQYEVRLPDGSSVWLNATSSLKYPASFKTMKNRYVELSGEAYFEIEKDKEHPFVVKTAKQEIKVLGTHFNVNAYEDESVTRTTLLEGKVEVRSSKHPIITLAPGKQSILDDHSMNVIETDIEEAVAWKNGNFNFNSEELPSIMRKLARWYNVEVVYTGGSIQTKSFTGKISKFKNLSQVLKMLSRTKAVHFKVKERRVIVSE